MTEFKVHIIRQENDCYVELWKVFNKKKYFARFTYGLPQWYFVCDPFGYCELDHPCPNDYVFIICDKNGNEISRESNGDPDDCPRALTLMQKTQEIWDSIEPKPEIKDGLNEWLLSYMTPENLAKDPFRTQFCPKENWTWAWKAMDHVSVLARYNHLGDEYCIYEITYKHLFCDCMWIEYMAGDAEMDWEYPSFIKWFGSFYLPEQDKEGTS